MALVVEDGSGVANANSYVSVSFVSSYFSDRGRPEWTAAGMTEKNSAVVRATDHIERRFGYRFKGKKAQAANSLSWPRSGVTLRDGTEIDDDSIPDRLKWACAEYARIALTTTELDPKATEVSSDASGKVTSTTTSRQVGSLKETISEDYENISERIRNAQELGEKPPSSLLVHEAALQEYPMADLFLEELVVAINTRAGAQANGALPAVSGQDGDKRFDDRWDDQFDWDGQYSSDNYNRYGYR